ncbi:MAG: UDP-N-acetylmuramyl pentapeptide phosphotransferase [Candidatus Krumholzibacteria bacterium]|nr:UDP-N-acetylmuramyl pentapeptide phosphotransferase [Candidatus Krumholzibacteria bacterium]
MVPLLLFFCLALVLSLTLTPLVIRLLRNSRVMDIPNRRSSHDQPVPRGGGFGILLPAVILVAAAHSAGRLAAGELMAALALGVAGMTLIGFLDDLYSLSALLRLVLEGLLMAGCLVVAPLSLAVIDLPFLPPLATGAAGIGLAWLFLVGFPNLFNFMDGINGLAGMQTLIAGAALAVLGHQIGNETVAWGAAAIAGGSLGFLRYNFPAARVFMGDSGSLPIGFFLAAAVLAIAAPGSQVPLVVPVLMLWVFLFDAGLTLLIRTCRRQRLHHAHRDHLYQRLIRLDYSHARVTTIYSVLMLGATVTAFCYLRSGDAVRLALLLVLAAVSAGLALSVLVAHRRRARQRIAESPRHG